MRKKMPFKRSQYFVRMDFQLRYIGLMLAVMLLTLLMTSYSIYCNSWALLGDKLARVYPQGRLVQIFRAVNLRLLLNMLFVAMLCSGIAIIASHKIAGPISRIVRFVNEITSGDYGKRIKLRKGDELNDLADALNRLVDKLESEKKS